MNVAELRLQSTRKRNHRQTPHGDIIRKGQLYKVKKRSGTGGDPGRVGAQKQKHVHSSTRTCSNLRSFYTNIDSFVKTGGIFKENRSLNTVKVQISGNVRQ